MGCTCLLTRMTAITIDTYPVCRYRSERTAVFVRDNIDRHVTFYEISDVEDMAMFQVLFDSPVWRVVIRRILVAMCSGRTVIKLNGRNVLVETTLDYNPGISLQVGTCVTGIKTDLLMIGARLDLQDICFSTSICDPEKKPVVKVSFDWVGSKDNAVFNDEEMGPLIRPKLLIG